MIKRSIKRYQPHKSCGPISAYKLDRLHFSLVMLQVRELENAKILFDWLRLIENYNSHCRTNNNQDYERNNNILGKCIYYCGNLCSVFTK